MIVEIIFFISLVAIIGMIFLKSAEMKSGKKSLLSRAGGTTDHFFHAAYAKVRFTLSHLNKNNGVNFLQWIAYHILSVFHKLFVYIREKAHRHPHSKKVIDMVTGKGEVNQHGGSSFYLKKIAEETKE
jgi:queuine/archaeosine tRNA-ribosyltransferase